MVVMAVPQANPPCQRKPQAIDARTKRVNDAADAVRLQGETGRVKTPDGEGRDQPERQPHGQPGGNAADPGGHGPLFNDFMEGHENDQCDAEAVATLAALAANCKRHRQQGQHEEGDHVDNPLVQFRYHGIARRSLRRGVELCVKLRQGEFPLIFAARAENTVGDFSKRRIGCCKLGNAGLRNFGVAVQVGPAVKFQPMAVVQS